MVRARNSSSFSFPGIHYDPILGIVYDETGKGISDALDGILRPPGYDDKAWEASLGMDPKLLRCVVVESLGPSFSIPFRFMRSDVQILVFPCPRLCGVQSGARGADEEQASYPPSVA